MRAPLGLLAALGCVAHAQPAAPLQPRVAPPTVTVGDLLTYAVEVPLSVGETVTGPGAEADLGPWEVRGREARPGPQGVTLTYTLAAFETGALEVPSLSITITGPSGKTRAVKTAPIKVTVASVLQGEDTQPADIVGPIALREKPAAIALRVVVGLIVVALLVGAARFLWRRRRRRRAEAASRPAPPDVQALEALEALRAAGLPEAGRVKEHYSELSEILRAYVAARWNVRTLEETTPQIAAQMRDDRHCAEQAPVVEDLLREADVVKFAKARPEAPACWSAVDGVERLVRETALRFPIGEEPGG